MRLFFAWVCPPLAVLSCGKPFSAVLNFFLLFFFWYPGVMHAQAVVDNYYADRRNKKMMRVVDYPAWAQHVFSAAPQDGRLELPKRKRQKAKAEPEAMSYDDPAIGRNGTLFRKRNRG